MPLIGPLIGIGIFSFFLYLIFLAMFGNSAAALASSVAAVAVMVFFTVVSSRASSQRMKTGGGTWVKEYDNTRHANSDAQAMTQHRWRMIGQSSSGVRGKIVITWQRVAADPTKGPAS